MSGSLVEMFKYNNWANQQLFETCRGLSESELDLVGAGTSESVRELLVHLAGGQQTLLLRTMGRQHEGEPGRESPWPGHEALADLILRSGEGLLSVADTVGDEDEVTLAYQGRAYRYPVVFFLSHAVHHAIEHRTEIKVALNQRGIETPDLDGWSYAGAAGYGKEAPPD